MPKYICKVYWERCGEVTVIADNREEAAKKAISTPIKKLILQEEIVPDTVSCDPDMDVQDHIPS